MRVLLIEDDSAIAQSIELMLKSESFNVYTTDLGEEGVDLGKLYDYDIILLDLNMPGMSGKAVLNALQEEAVRAKVIVLTVSENAEDLADVMAAGAQGYLLKNIDASHFIDALRRVASGETIISPEMTVRLVSAMRAKETPPSNTPSDALLARLTPREREILAALAEGASNKEIARQFDLSESTVKVHVQNILRKLECQSRVQAAVIAVEAGLGRQ